MIVVNVFKNGNDVVCAVMYNKENSDLKTKEAKPSDSLSAAMSHLTDERR